MSSNTIGNFLPDSADLDMGRHETGQKLGLTIGLHISLQQCLQHKLLYLQLPIVQ